MGKAVVAVFFIVGFVIFSFIKSATQGVKQAYKAVNNEPEVTRQPAKAIDHSSSASDVYEAISTSLLLQKALVTDIDGKFKQNAEDNWSLGYVGGYTDAFLFKHGIGTDDIGHAVMVWVFKAVFGEDKGTGYFVRYINLHEEGDSASITGAKTGGEEALEWLRKEGDNDSFPLSWSKHVHAHGLA